jgi:hypothetical protein
MKTFDIWVRDDHYTCYRVQAEDKDEAYAKYCDCSNYDEIYHDEFWGDNSEIDEINEVDE